MLLKISSSSVLGNENVKSAKTSKERWTLLITTMFLNSLKNSLKKWRKKPKVNNKFSSL